jgi:hypothetical protein
MERVYVERRCEMSRPARMLVLPSLLTVLILWGGSVASEPVRSQPRGFRNVFVRLSGGEEVTVARNGPIALVARCEFGAPGVEILFTSSEDGWFSNSFARDAGDEAVLCSGGMSGRFDQCEDGSALSAGGRYLGVSGDTSFGLDVLGSDCVVVGSVTVTFDPGGE